MTELERMLQVLKEQQPSSPMWFQVIDRIVTILAEMELADQKSHDEAEF